MQLWPQSSRNPRIYHLIRRYQDGNNSRLVDTMIHGRYLIFLVFANFYCKFIKNHLKMILHLINSHRRTNHFHELEVQVKGLESLKNVSMVETYFDVSIEYKSMLFTILKWCLLYSNGRNMLECECMYGTYSSYNLNL